MSAVLSGICGRLRAGHIRYKNTNTHTNTRARAYAHTHVRTHIQRERERERERGRERERERELCFATKGQNVHQKSQGVRLFLEPVPDHFTQIAVHFSGKT